MADEPLKNGHNSDEDADKTEALLPEEKREALLPEEEQIPVDSREKMKKNITIVRGIALVVGTMIGTGIFITPNSITQRVNAPATSILVWMSGGLIAAVGGIVYSELGTMIPLSGSEVAYLKRIYGPVPSFMALWLLHFILAGITRSINVLGFSKYFWSLFYDNPDDVNWWVSKAVALTVFFIIVAVTTTKPTLILRSIVFFTGAKITACLIIIIAGIVSLAKGNTENIEFGFTGTNTDPRDWSEAFNAIIFSYGGWEQMCAITSEMKNPQRDVPIVIGSSIAIVTFIYTLTVASFHIVVPQHVMIQDVAVASEFGMRSMGETGKIILAVGVVFSTLGQVQCAFLTGSRLIHAGAAENLLPSCIGLVSKRFRTPVVSILYMATIATVFILVGKIGMLINSASFTKYPFFFACSVGVLVMRVTHPDLPRPYRAPLIFPILFSLFTLFVFILPFLGDSWQLSLVWVIVALVGIPVYYLMSRNVFGWKFLTRCNKKLTQKLGRILNCE